MLLSLTPSCRSLLGLTYCFHFWECEKEIKSGMHQWYQLEINTTFPTMAVSCSEKIWARISEYCTVSFLKKETSHCSHPLAFPGVNTLPLPFLCDSGQRHKQLEIKAVVIWPAQILWEQKPGNCPRQRHLPGQKIISSLIGSRVY